ncbi:hypothetical protein [Stenotrophomonas maltophilia]|uniref:hypothetical protein n=1 Tax=Stenotrophomonas maltophilia TaxID=40324 RepID=UPI001FA6AFD2|nr:hypothetical protein [Stenotrophomonas maltophilia]
MFPSLDEANSLLHPFGISLRKEAQSERVWLDGWIDWRATLSGSVNSSFSTIGHFWAEWIWYVAWTLESYRKNSLFTKEFVNRDLQGRVKLLAEMEIYHSRGSKEIDEVVRGDEVSICNLPTDWNDRLLVALAHPNNGAAFYHGHLCDIAWNIDPEAMNSHAGQ